MEINNFILEFIENINKLRDSEFKKYNFTYEEKVSEKKVLNENSLEFIKYKNTLYKKALLEKYKPGNAKKKEYETVHQDIDILEDDIFNNNINENKEDEVKLNIDIMTKDEKLLLINDFIQRKNIILSQEENNKINLILDDESFVLKKYISISKIYQHVIKISFIKKYEDGTYYIDICDTKPKKKTNFFNKKP
jgi:hypothetical protein